MKDVGRVGKPTGLSQAEPQERLGPSGFDPSRVEQVLSAFRDLDAQAASHRRTQAALLLGLARMDGIVVIGSEHLPVDHIAVLVGPKLYQEMRALRDGEGGGQ
jgi:hypothetical protein